MVEEVRILRFLIAIPFHKGETIYPWRGGGIRIVGFRRHKGRRAVPIDGSGWMDTQRATLLRSIIHYLPVFRYGINILGA